MISKYPMASSLEPINLQGGWPTPRLHPVEAMKSAAAKVFGGQDAKDKLQYGPEHGDASLRAALCDWLSQTYKPIGLPLSTGEVMVTNGASNGLATILQKHADPGVTRNIWMVEPTYFLACPVFRDAGFTGRIRGVPEGAGGVDLSYLRSALNEDASLEAAETPIAMKKTAKDGYPKIFRHVLYLIPTFSNPGGWTMSVDARTELVQIAREHDVLVVTDDVYDFLRWPSSAGDCYSDIAVRPTPPPRLVDIDRTLEGTQPYGNAVSNGSFSKIVAPGVRVGWLQGTPDFIANMGTVGATVSGGCQSHMGSLIINQMLTDGSLQQHLEETLIPTYRQRYYAMINAIKVSLYPLGVRISNTGATDALAGGFFLYILFPDDGPSVADIARVALDEYQLRIAPGALFSVEKGKSTSDKQYQLFLRGARLCWAWQEEQELVEGIERLADAFSQAKLRQD